VDENLYNLHLKAGRIFGEQSTCGSKRKFSCELEAQKAADAHNKWDRRKSDAEPYPCAFCKAWHIGRKMTVEYLKSVVDDWSL